MNFWHCYISPEDTFLLAPINPDRQVNYGCNLKWKPADKSHTMLATVVNFSNKIASRSLARILFF